MGCWSINNDYEMKLAARQGREPIREHIREEQALAKREKSVAVAAGGTAGRTQQFLKRVRKAISTNIGLYEIRINLFVWGLFRMGKQKES